MKIFCIIAMTAAMCIRPTLSLKKGNAHFAAAGVIAAPAYYQTLSVFIRFSAYHDRLAEATKEKERAIAKFNEQMVALNITKAERKKVIDRVTLRTVRSFERLKKADANLRTLTQFSDSRSKRFVTALALLGVTIAAGSAIWQAIQVDNTAKSISRVDHKVQQVIEDLYQMRVAIQAWEHAAETEIMEERLVYELNAALDHAAEVIEELVQGIYSVRAHKLHPAILPPQDMVILSKKLKDRSSKLGHTPVLDAKAHLEDYPISYVLGDKGLLLLIHVPFVTDGRHMLRQLFQLQHAVFEYPDGFQELKGAETYIAVNKKEEVFSSHTLEELQQCHEIAQLRICTEPSVLYKTPSTCIEALYRQDHEKASQLCRKEPVKSSTPAFDVGPLTFVLANKQSVRSQCRGKMLTRVIPANTTFTIPRGCSLESDDFVLAPSYKTPKLMRIAIHQPILEPRIAGHEVLEAKLPEAVGKPPVIPTFDFSYKEGWTTMEVVAMTVTVLLLSTALGASICCVRTRCKRRRAKAAREERQPRSTWTSTPRQRMMAPIGIPEDRNFPTFSPPHLVHSDVRIPDGRNRVIVQEAFQEESRVSHEKDGQSGREQASRHCSESRTALGEASGTTYSPKSVSYGGNNSALRGGQKAREREKERRREEESIEQTYAAVRSEGERGCAVLAGGKRDAYAVVHAEGGRGYAVQAGGKRDCERKVQPCLGHKEAIPPRAEDNQQEEEEEDWEEIPASERGGVGVRWQTEEQSSVFDEPSDHTVSHQAWG